MDKHESYSRIEPAPRAAALGLRGLWDYRELVYFLAWRDIKLRYKQTWVGSAWAILQPFATMVVFSVFFGHFAKIPSDGIPYPIFTYAALLPWQLFSTILSQSANSLVANQNLIRKVYFPRAVLPFATVFPGMVDFVSAFTVLLGMMAIYRIFPGWKFLALPFFLLLALAAALAVGIWLSALNARYRDIHHAIPFLLQIWFFATPVTYSTSIISSPYRVWFGLNPLVGVVEGFRWSLLGKSQVCWPMIFLSILVINILLFLGLLYFRTVERNLADVV